MASLFLDMKRLKTIEQDFILKPNPYISEERADQVLWKLAVGEVLAISAFTCFSLSFLRLKPSITLASSFRNFTYFQAITSIGMLYYHLHELEVVAKDIPDAEI